MPELSSPSSPRSTLPRLIDVGIYRAPLSAYWRDPDRYAPHNLISSTAVLYAAGLAQHAPQVAPPPVFRYGALPAHSAAASVNINYLYCDLTWTWVPDGADWVRSYVGAGPAAMGEGGDITTDERGGHEGGHVPEPVRGGRHRDPRERAGADRLRPCPGVPKRRGDHPGSGRGPP